MIWLNSIMKLGKEHYMNENYRNWRENGIGKEPKPKIAEATIKCFSRGELLGLAKRRMENFYGEDWKTYWARLEDSGYNIGEYFDVI